MKTPLDFPVVANNDRYILMQALNPPDPAAPAGTPGTPIDITGFAIKWQFFAEAAPTVALATKQTSDASITIVDAANGKFSFWVRAADTQGKDPGEYIHEAVTVDGAGHPVTLTNNDPRLTAGRMTIRTQYTAQ